MSKHPLILKIEREIDHQKKVLAWCRKNLKKLAPLPMPTLYGVQLDFDRLKHDQVIQVMLAIPGKWDKTPTDEGRVHYQTTTAEGIRVRCWQGEPPPSCHVEPYDIVEPEKRVTKYRLVCQPA